MDMLPRLTVPPFTRLHHRQSQWRASSRHSQVVRRGYRRAGLDVYAAGLVKVPGRLAAYRLCRPDMHTRELDERLLGTYQLCYARGLVARPLST